MKETAFKRVKFIPKEDKDFGVTVRKRVREYFKENNISQNGDYRVWVKTILLLVLYLGPFTLLLTNIFSGNLFAYYGLWILTGLGMAGCGLSVMHDAGHGAFSKNKATNKFVGLIMNLVGGYMLNWKIQHNILHHSYTNIDGHDEDINPGGLMRFSPHQPAKPIHRFQIVYAWFLYGLMTFSWVTLKDFKRLKSYHKQGLLKMRNASYQTELIKLIGQKICYYAIFLVLPFTFIELSWGYILSGWFGMHFLAGLILACIFQPAHVNPNTEYPLPNPDNIVEGDWAKHQMLTTANFAPNAWLFSWYVGGLNFQIEHHLFPSMSHIHHKKVSKIVKATAEEFGLPYHSHPTFFGALYDHAKMLYSLRK